MAYPTAMWDVIGLWTGWVLMLMIYSYPLYKENPVYRTAEYMFIGMMLAINVVTNFSNVVRICITPMMGGDFLMIVPLILGIMIYTMLIPEYRWVSRYPVALLVGAGFGLGIRGTIAPNIQDAIISTITAPSDGGMMAWINFLYIAVGLICSMMYFLLTFEHTGPLKAPTRIGRLFIMIALGAYFGNTVLFRFTMLTGRAQFFLQVLKLIPM
ncbi:MAG: hypothetical protein NWE89_11035 [Candidatus Bathyarchaeota archaeon]|nr:hypothetical protein [Candidatus Bathyarchaeota archaeon]